jgi:hypothetical protein
MTENEGYAWSIKNLTRNDNACLSETFIEPTLEDFHSFFINQSPANWLVSDSYYIYDANMCIGNKGGSGEGYWKNVKPIYINGNYWMKMGKIIMIKFVDDHWVKYHPIDSNQELIYEKYKPNSIIKNKKSLLDRLLN